MRKKISYWFYCLSKLIYHKDCFELNLINSIKQKEQIEPWEVLDLRKNNKFNCEYSHKKSNVVNYDRQNFDLQTNFKIKDGNIVKVQYKSVNSVR